MINKKLFIVVFVATFIIAVFIGNTIKAQQLAAYAQANNCTWHATGTAYGDDRDWICK